MGTVPSSKVVQKMKAGDDPVYQQGVPGLLGSTTLFAKDFSFDGPLVQVSSKDTVNQAFKTLVKNNLLAAPVYDEAKGKFLGFFDVLDALQLICLSDMFVQVICALNPENIAADAHVQTSDSDSTLEQMFEDESNEMVHESVWHPISESTPWHHILYLLSKNIRRLPVMNASGGISKIISQSQIVRTLNDSLGKLESSGKQLPDVFNKSIAELNLGLCQVHGVDADSNTLSDAFSLMMEKHISAVAVTNSDGSLFSCITTKDIRAFHGLEDVMNQRLDAQGGRSAVDLLLEKSCRQFVYRCHLVQLRHGSGSPCEMCVTVSPQDTFRKVIHRLAESRKHRLFIMDADSKPVGVVSVSDISLFLFTKDWFSIALK